MRDKEFIDLSNAYNQICEQSYGIDASKHGGPDKLLQKMVDEKKRRGDKDGGGEVVQSGLQKANYEPEGELVLEKDETEEGITGLPIPKKRMSSAKRHEFEKKRRAERKKRGDDRVGDTFSQHRMTGSRGRGSEYQNIRTVREEVLVDYLLGEGFASDEKSAQAIAGVMSEEWKDNILGEEKKEFPSDKVRKQSAKHEKNYLTRPNSYSGQASKSKSRKMKAIASTVEVGDDPRNTMHGQDLRKIK
jgi:hypothetical protein